LGSGGAELIDASSRTPVAAFPVVVVDTTGAGDAFCGAFAAQIAAGAVPTEALRFANAAGALATTALGAQSALPTEAAVDALCAAAGGSPVVHGRDGV
jgi:ribokinase